MSSHFGALVTAVIATHNRADLLPRAIDSVLRQTYDNLEIIVVDDGSRDGTEGVVHEYQKKHGRIRYLRFDSSRGACAARNYGIREARGEFVAGLDDDDEWLPRRVEILLKNFSDDYAYSCAPDRIIYRDRIEYRKRRSIITLDEMLYRNVTGNQVLTKKERFLEVGGFDEGLTSGQDYDLWLRLLGKYGPARMVSEPLQNVYRDHLGERVSNSRNKIQGDWRLYNKHKSKMNPSQRMHHLMELKRLKGRSLRLAEVFTLWNGDYFWQFFRYYMRRRLGRI